MSHVRKQIRDAVATTLTGLTTTGTNVFKGRYFSMQTPKLPALLVYTTNEDAELSIMGSSRGSDRVLSLVVEGYAISKTIVEDTLDQIAVEVEEAMASDYTLNGLTRDVRYTGFELDANADPEQTVAVIRLTFDIKYRVSAGDVEAAL
jgi:hypothetical protein